MLAADKVKAFEEQQAELRHARRLLQWAAAFTFTSPGIMIARWARGEYSRNIGGQQIWFRPITPAPALALVASAGVIALALATVFGAGWHILVMAVQSLRR
ncbi:MAG: hypothetical protein ACE5FI_17990, partial [Anaerolineales bacterium]